MMERDDFEFKPITEGLGFHKKVLDIKEDQGPGIGGSLSSGMMPGGIMPRPKNQSAINQPAQTINQTTQQNLKNQTARPSLQTPAKTPPRAPISQPQPRGWSPSLPGLDLLEDVDPRQQVLVMSPTSWSAGLFDAAMVLGLTLIFSTVVFALTQIELNDLVGMLGTEGGAQAAAIVLLIGVFEIYAVTCRTFFGKTLGEYAFDFRLGAPHEQQYLLYPLKVAWRTFLVAITGFILLPIISTIVRRDVAGILSGVSLYTAKR
jgi:hypothetical protein